MLGKLGRLGWLLGMIRGRLVPFMMVAGLLTGGSAIIGPQNLPGPLATLADKARSVIPFDVETLTSRLPFLGSADRGSGSGTYPPVNTSEMLRLMNTIPVKGQGAPEKYKRLEQFGKPWTDDNGVQFGHNGCGTRDDILARDMHDVKKQGCTVISGVLPDPYTGKDINFHRTDRAHPQGSMTVQIDHVVALGNAWVTGAFKLTPASRVNIANDPLNLLAVDGPQNNNKKDSDASAWLPPNKNFRCQYVSRQVQVKAKYHLWMTASEKDAIRRVLSKCPA